MFLNQRLKRLWESLKKDFIVRKPVENVDTEKENKLGKEAPKVEDNLKDKNSSHLKRGHST